MLQRFFQKYTGFLRSLKAVYVINNLLHAKQLRANKALYQQYGLKKSVFSPIGSQDFKGNHHPDVPWIDQSNALEQYLKNPAFESRYPDIQDKIKQFITDGYLVLEQFFPAEDTEALNEEVATMLQSGKTGFNYTGRKIFNFFEQSALADHRFFRNAEILRLLSYLLGKQAVPFQTLNFTEGSEQRAHSDSIHMTTEPQGYLIATWIALEDCGEDAGPLFYYPGSHRLPFLMTDHYPSGNTALTIGAESNRRYEDAIAQQIEEKGLKKQLFLPKRGDVLIWHANLLHGGSPILRPGATRKSMVCHYYAKGVICYHEMSQRPAILK
jgi:hypothetical protein